MVNPEAESFNPGGVKDRVDTRDFQFSEIGFGTAPFDWSTGYDVEADLAKTLPVKDQDGSFSCGGQAWSQYAGAIEAAATKTLEERSAKFFYAQTYQNGGGSSGRDNANVFISQGSCRELVLTSYENGLPPKEAFMIRGQDINDVARNDAKSDKGFNYAQVGNLIDSVAQAVRDNNGAIIGITGQNNGTWGSTYPKPPVGTNGLWNHWVYAGKAKLIFGVKHIGILNSWGKAVGDKGWQWIPETYFLAKVGGPGAINGANAVWSVWTHSYNSMPDVGQFKHNFASDIKQGDSGPEVTALQKALTIDGDFPSSVTPTGFFGDVTLQAVKTFQTKYKISPVSGFVGPLTRTQLNKLFNI